MKKIITFLFLMLSISLSAQNEGFNYKALLADNGEALSETQVSIRFTIIQSEGTVYTETISTTTNENGVLSVVMGSDGGIETGFENINWQFGAFLKVEIDTGDGFVDFGTNPFHNVPTAMYAEKAGNVFTGDYGDLTNSPSVFYKIASTDNAETIDDSMYHTGSVGIGEDISNSDVKSKLYVYKEDSEVSQFTSANTFIKFDFSGKRGIGQLIYMTGNSIPAPNNPSVDGQEIIVSTSGDARMKCINTQINNDGNGSHYSIYNRQSGDGTGQHVGIYNSLMKGKGVNYGIMNNVSSGTTTAGVYGIYNNIGGTASNYKYGTFNIIDASIPGQHYAVYGDAQKEGSYAGYFLGDVSISRNLKIEGGTPALGKVLTSDENGWASWKVIPNTSKWKSSGETVYRSGDVGIGTSSPVAPLEIKSDKSPSLIIGSSTTNFRERPGIQFKNNTSQFISGDDGSDEIFGFYSTWASTRSYDARLRVYGKASGSWGKYIQFTHDGTDATIKTDAGKINLEPEGKEVNIEGKITSSTSKNNADLKAYAYGTIKYDGTKYSGTNNFHVDTGVGTGVYKIIFDDENYDYQHFTTVISLINTDFPREYLYYATNNTLVIKIWFRSSEGGIRLTNNSFSFITYKY